MSQLVSCCETTLVCHSPVTLPRVEWAGQANAKHRSDHKYKEHVEQDREHKLLGGYWQGRLSPFRIFLAKKT